jgi:hypothetical protein
MRTNTSLALALAALFGAADAAVAQPPAFQKTNQSAKQLAANLQASVETAGFQKPDTLKGALVRFHQTLAKKGKPVAFKVDHDAFKEENPDAPDVYESGVTLQAKDKTLPAAKILAAILEQVPTGNAAYVVRDGYIEITTKQRAGKAAKK